MKFTLFVSLALALACSAEACRSGPASLPEDDLRGIIGGAIYCAKNMPMPNTGCNECQDSGNYTIIVTTGPMTYTYVIPIWRECETTPDNDMCYSTPTTPSFVCCFMDWVAWFTILIFLYFFPQRSSFAR